MTVQEQNGRGEAEVIQEVDRLGYLYRFDGFAFRMYVAQGEGPDREIRFTAATPGQPEVRLPASAA